ncbi:hypothetical protein MMC22_011810 [Lobaria immixta]|nr:hypothetical protein [Lobaria immixta]
MPSIQTNGRFSLKKCQLGYEMPKLNQRRITSSAGIAGEISNSTGGDCDLILSQKLPGITITKLLSRSIQLKNGGGEVGAVILTNIHLCGLSTKRLDKDLAKAVEEWNQLRTMWVDCDSPCSQEGCKICSPEPKPAEDKLDEGKGNRKEEGEESDGGDNDGRYWGQLRGGQAPSRDFPKRHRYRPRPRKLGYGRHLFRAMRRDRTKPSRRVYLGKSNFERINGETAGPTVHQA